MIRGSWFVIRSLFRDSTAFGSEAQARRELAEVNPKSAFRNSIPFRPSYFVLSPLSHSRPSPCAKRGFVWRYTFRQFRLSTLHDSLFTSLRPRAQSPHPGRPVVLTCPLIAEKPLVKRAPNPSTSYRRDRGERRVLLTMCITRRSASASPSSSLSRLCGLCVLRGEISGRTTARRRFVPEGHSRIAQRLIAGWLNQNEL